MNKKQEKMNTPQSELQNTARQHQSENSMTSKTGYKEQELVPSRKNLKR
ncbi:hypothetical protein [Oceanirhabdus seepicola]|uniref:Uncharacterized protein n=1 Tax=Oceanirhabdus seepicola TaxID=2828781 RepID=A0A9J6P470_9CLOT|nr:hypothetical protein [Oceanirhabdus seepicola]MCM1990857.1 hypothetical protein [Oceanirhabdus seepicola]